MSRIAKQGGLFYGRVGVGACFAALCLVLGSIYAFGAFFTPLTREFGAGRAASPPARLSPPGP